MLLFEPTCTLLLLTRSTHPLPPQERAPQDWPTGWVEQNLPGLTRLQRNGLTFKRAYTNACMCTSARAALFTGYFNPQHNARYVLEQDMPSSLYPQVGVCLCLFCLYLNKKFVFCVQCHGLVAEKSMADLQDRQHAAGALSGHVIDVWGGAKGFTGQ